MQSTILDEDFSPSYESIRKSFESCVESIHPLHVTGAQRLINENFSIFQYHMTLEDLRPLIAGTFSNRTINVWRHGSFLGIVIETKINASKMNFRNILSTLLSFQVEKDYRLENGRICRLILEEKLLQMDMKQTLLEFSGVCDRFEKSLIFRTWI